jgi:SAM-dependent methyltransferase
VTATGWSASRLAAGVRRHALVLYHRGDRVRCPLCGRGFQRFAADWNRADALCWRCGAQERHRAQWLLLQRRPDLLDRAGSLLHFAPEWCLEHRLRARPDLRYLTADLEATGVDLRLDLRALDLGDASFDAVLCSHVLEHIDDDARAMRELRRVTAPGGWCLVMVPLDLHRAHTYEDLSITDPADRVRAFWQSDHVRLYAPDIAHRLRAAGFDVEVINMTDGLCERERLRHGLLASDLIFLCRPAPATDSAVDDP